MADQKNSDTRKAPTAPGSISESALGGERFAYNGICCAKHASVQRDCPLCYHAASWPDPRSIEVEYSSISQEMFEEIILPVMLKEGEKKKAPDQSDLPESGARDTSKDPGSAK